jgi:3'-phosphoadenosine 5'-phosphosulfate sulfotransferase (PAPS reductase)/FAD synthetase
VYVRRPFKIDKHLRAWVGKHGSVVAAVGIRAAESRNRAARPVWGIREKVASQDRQAFTWNPLHHFTTEEVWQVLGVSQAALFEVRQTMRDLRTRGASVWEALAETNWAYHVSYALGAERMSCSICILASKADLLVGIEHNPQYYSDLVDLEISTGWSFQPNRFLGELRPDLLSEAQRQAFAAMRERQMGAAQPRLF